MREGYLHYLHGDIQWSQHHFLNRLFFAYWIVLASLVKNQLTVNTGVYFWTLSIPLIYVSWCTSGAFWSHLASSSLVLSLPCCVRFSNELTEVLLWPFPPAFRLQETHPGAGECSQRSRHDGGWAHIHEARPEPKISRDLELCLQRPDSQTQVSGLPAQCSSLEKGAQSQNQ